MEKMLNQIIDGYQAELIETVQRLISFDSVYEESNDPNPLCKYSSSLGGDIEYREEYGFYHEEFGPLYRYN